MKVHMERIYLWFRYSVDVTQQKIWYVLTEYAISKYARKLCRLSCWLHAPNFASSHQFDGKGLIVEAIVAIANSMKLFRPECFQIKRIVQPLCSLAFLGLANPYVCCILSPQEILATRQSLNVQLKYEQGRLLCLLDRCTRSHFPTQI